MNRRIVACPGPVPRRQFLKIGSLSLAGVGAAGVLPLDLRAADGEQRRADTAVILLWLPGGPPHMETYDMKPDAPDEYRGEFRPIATNVPGIDVCELLPRHAKVADKYSLIRSIAHTFSDHGGGHKKFLTGRDPLEPTGFVNDYPMVGSMALKASDGRRPARGVPMYISGADPGRDHIDVFSFGSAYLGPATHPFSVVGDPSAKDFEVKNIGVPEPLAGRVQQRIELLNGLKARSTSARDEVDVFQEVALSLMTSDAARRAFDLSQEPQELRERYGMHAWGQRALLARRLVEAGAGFVTMVLENPYQSGVPWLKDGTYNWDSHAVNCHIFNDAKVRFPIYDQAVTALIEDLHARGLNRRTLLIVTGEFGRTPRISYANGTSTGVKQPGRDHWPQAMSVLVSGGGLRMGQVVGSTNAKGEHPQSRPLIPNDLWATMFRHLGIDPHTTAFPDYRGRPMPILQDGAPIAELV